MDQRKNGSKLIKDYLIGKIYGGFSRFRLDHYLITYDELIDSNYEIVIIPKGKEEILIGLMDYHLMYGYEITIDKEEIESQSIFFNKVEELVEEFLKEKTIL